MSTNDPVLQNTLRLALIHREASKNKRLQQLGNTISRLEAELHTQAGLLASGCLQDGSVEGIVNEVERFHQLHRALQLFRYCLEDESVFEVMSESTLAFQGKPMPAKIAHLFAKVGPSNGFKRGA